MCPETRSLISGKSNDSAVQLALGMVIIRAPFLINVRIRLVSPASIAARYGSVPVFATCLILVFPDLSFRFEIECFIPPALTEIADLSKAGVLR